MRKIILTISLISVLCLGCNEVQLSPRYQQALELSAINVRGMLKDCQGGNQQSCEEGLAAAAQLLDYIVDASYGRAE
jgi:hypothetical protein